MMASVARFLAEKARVDYIKTNYPHLLKAIESSAKEGNYSLRYEAIAPFTEKAISCLEEMGYTITTGPIVLTLSWRKKD